MKTETEKLVTVTLNNTFHDTSVKVRVPESWTLVGHDGDIQNRACEHEVYARLQFEADYGHEAGNSNNLTPGAKARLRRVYKALCGMSDCCCGVIR
jgi:hypothetical protein